MSSLYDRKAYVIFGPSKELSVFEGGFITSGLSTGESNNVLNITQLGFPYINLDDPFEKDNKGFRDLRIVFSIEKTLESKENDSTIEIYNVNEDSYKMLQKIDDTYLIQLSVGYGDESKNSIFIGNIENSFYTRDKANWTLTIKGKDGQEIIQNSLINKSYREGFDIKSVLTDMLDSTNVSTKGVFKEAKKWILENLTSAKRTQNGLTISGRLIDEVNKLLAEVGASMSIQDNKAQIIYDDSNSKNDIILLSPSSGLIGSPVNKGKEEGIEFKCLLIPLIKPGVLVKIESKSINDYFRVDKVNFKGDTHGNDWECECEAVKPSNINTDLSEIRYYNNLLIEEELSATWKSLI